EGYNSRLGSLFPVHPHIYKFIELLRDEHLFQHHHAEQSRTYLPRRQKPSQDTNAQLIDLLNKHSNRELTDLELALQCGKAVKTQLDRNENQVIGTELIKDPRIVTDHRHVDVHFAFHLLNCPQYIKVTPYIPRGNRFHSREIVGATFVVNHWSDR
ncbi:unnamed protein product, partial [Rotaria socialis]